MPNLYHQSRPRSTLTDLMIRDESDPPPRGCLVGSPKRTGVLFWRCIYQTMTRILQYREVHEARLSLLSQEELSNTGVLIATGRSAVREGERTYRDTRSFKGERVPKRTSNASPDLSLPNPFLSR